MILFTHTQKYVIYEINVSHLECQKIKKNGLNELHLCDSLKMPYL